MKKLPKATKIIFAIYVVIIAGMLGVLCTGMIGKIPW